METEKRLIVLQDAIDIIVNTPSEIANGVTRGSKKHWTANDVLGVLADRQFEIFVLLDKVKRVYAAEVVHGRWVVENETSIRCSECCFNRASIKIPLDYCPKCGAKMDGDGNG